LRKKFLPSPFLLHLPIKLLELLYELVLDYYPLVEQQLPERLNLKHVRDGHFLDGDDLK